ncbi:hypothetical protein K503DRAFT_801534 [Rhizopogon vinicolor AM-OR11-026]|uniref:Uncharacterized protein n=1 Tax=Rhizopogon vinicolor AM-OR11-026 TaxID=1314800 RepID=A0A1B7MWR6_9AGAM|nr:hypothetical protein K503DRAFT_801534 [Rhizopogon vinicolor AM-OR11-026]
MSTWKEGGDPWTGHDDHKDVNELPAGTEVARYDANAYRVVFSKILEDVLAGVRGDPLAMALSAEAGPSRGKKKKTSKHFLDREIPGQRRNMANGYIDRSHREVISSEFQLFADADNPSSTRSHGAEDLFNRKQPSSSTKGKQQERRSTERHQKSSMFLSLAPEKEKKPDPQHQVYDVDLMKVEQRKILSMFPHLPGTTAHSSSNGLLMQFCRARFVQQKDIASTSMASQSQPEAGPSCITETGEYPEAQS